MAYEHRFYILLSFEPLRISLPLPLSFSYCTAETAMFNLSTPFVNGLLEDWRVPALSSAVVQRSVNGSLECHTAHYGVFVDGQRPDDSTLYNIGSISKSVAHFGRGATLTGLFRSFTAIALAMLIDSGELRWDTRIQEVIPEFRVVDDEVSRQATVLDLLVSHFSLL